MTFVLNSKNIEKVIAELKKAIPPEEDRGIIIPRYFKTNKINRKKYKGKGRPKYSDYIYVHYKKMFKGLI